MSTSLSNLIAITSLRLKDSLSLGMFSFYVFDLWSILNMDQPSLYEKLTRTQFFMNEF